MVGIISPHRECVEPVHSAVAGIGELIFRAARTREEKVDVEGCEEAAEGSLGDRIEGPPTAPRQGPAVRPTPPPPPLHPLAAGSEIFRS